MKKIIVAGIGPGGPEDMTPAVTEAIKEAEVIVGYKFYFQFIKSFIPPQCECIDTGMKKERERAELAFIQAEQGKTGLLPAWHLRFPESGIPVRSSYRTRPVCHLSLGLDDTLGDDRASYPCRRHW